MASFVFTNGFVLINTVDLSNHVKSVKLNYKAETPDNTAMSLSSKTQLPGLKEWDVEVELNQDFVPASVDATLFPLVGAAAFAVEFRGDAGGRTTSNPAFTGNALLESYPPLGNKVGEVAMTTIKLSGTGTLSRQTA
jgi:hypothetical protein